MPLAMDRRPSLAQRQTPSARRSIGLIQLVGLFGLLLGCSAEPLRQEDAAPRARDTGTERGAIERGLAEGDGALDSATSEGGQSDLPQDLPPPDLALTPGVFELRTSSRNLTLWWAGKGVVRLRYLPAGASPQPDRGWTLPLIHWPTASLAAKDAGEAWLIETTELLIYIDKQDASIRLEDRAHRPLFTERKNHSAPFRRKVVAELPASAHIYGLGEKLGPLDKRGMSLRMWNTDVLQDGTFPTDEDPLYQSIPYFIIHTPQRAALGVYLASTFETRFDFGKADPEDLSFETADGDLDYVLLYGPSIKEVVRGFTSLVGRTALPPLWALGYHQCKWSYSTESEVRAVTRELRARKIPSDGIWLDIDHMDGFRSFTFSPSAFPDPKGLIADLASEGFKTTVIIDPGIKHDPGGSYRTFNDGLSGDHFVKDPAGELVITPVWPGDAVFPDFTAARTRAWWGEQLQGLVQAGVRGVWIDMNEPATFKAEGFPLYSRWAGEGIPTNHLETHNVFALLMAQATAEGLRRWAPDQRPFVLTRAGFAGIQRHAAVWTGDTPSSWEHLAMAPATLLNMGLSGLPFVGSDVGGFSGNPGGELYARWMQLGALSPFFRSHVATGQPPQEPWAFGPGVEAISRSVIELRYRRLPYLYSLMRQAQVFGDPPLRALVYEFPDDPETAQLSHQLMLGDQLLAAPVVVAGQRFRRIYLPRGLWTDYDTGTVFRGPAWIHLATPLAKLPLFVRENGILPAWDVHQYVGEKPHSLLYLDLYPIANAPVGELALYLDDGQSQAYAKGAYQELPLRLITRPEGATLSIGHAQGSYRSSEERLWLVFHHIEHRPSGASANGRALSELQSLDALRSQDGWFYDAKSRVGHVSISAFRGGTTIVLAYDATRSPPGPVTLTFTIALPENNPSGIYFASTLDDWRSDARPLTLSGVRTATLKLELQAGESFEYKYTGGSWELSEQGLGCTSIANRSLTVVDNPSHSQTINDRVEAWAQHCP